MFAPISAIGSLPHHNVDAALQYAFNFDIPFLPQIPMRDANEYMLAQALAGLPGLHTDTDGSVYLDMAKWRAGAEAFDAKLSDVIAQLQTGGRKELKFDLVSDQYRCWRPFLFELQERKLPAAKVQIAGPLTAQWALQLSDGTNVANHPDLGAQIFRLITAKGLTLAHGLVARGVQPILFVDEPGLYALNSRDPQHKLALNELRLMIAAFRKAQARVGIHCCSNTDWKTVLGMGINILSLDVALSLDSLVTDPENKKELIRFLEDGGTLSLGVVPTDREVATVDQKKLFETWINLLEHALGRESMLYQQALKHSILTPACGLGLKSTGEAEAVLAQLKTVQEAVRSRISTRMDETK